MFKAYHSFRGLLTLNRAEQSEQGAIHSKATLGRRLVFNTFRGLLTLNREEQPEQGAVHSL